MQISSGVRVHHELGLKYAFKSKSDVWEARYDLQLFGCLNLSLFCKENPNELTTKTSMLEKAGSSYFAFYDFPSPHFLYPLPKVNTSL